MLDRTTVGRYITQELDEFNATLRTTGRLDLYVDAATGDDANGGTEDAPLASLVEAERRIPLVVDHAVVIHVAPHTGDGYAPPTFRCRLLNASIDVYASDVTVLMDDGVCLAGSSTSNLVTSGLTVDELRGKTIEMTSGALEGYRRTISTNTTTGIEPCVFWPTAPAAGDTFRIIEPAVQIDLGSDNYAPWTVSEDQRANTSQTDMGEGSNARVAPAINLINLRFHFSGTALVGTLVMGPRVNLFGIDTNSGKGLTASYGACSVGTDSTVIDTKSMVSSRLLDLPDDAWAGWGLHITSHFLLANELRGVITGLVTPRAILYSSDLAFSGAHVHTSGLSLSAFSGSYSSTRLTTGTHNRCRVRVHNDTGDAVSTGYNPLCTLLLLGNEVYVSAPNGAGLSASASNIVTISGAPTITGNACLKASAGGRIYVRSTPTLTATGNEIEVGNTPTTGTLATDLANEGDYLSEGDGSIVQRTP